MSYLVMSLLLACASEIDNKQAAQVKEATTSAPNVASKAGGWTLDPTSKVEWVGSKVTKDQKGGFKKFTGSAQVEGNELKQITADIDISSLFSDHPKLTKHLLNVDFFEVEKYATATFKSTEISKNHIKGILDLHGIQKEISFAATITQAEKSIGIKSEFTINRRLWNINYDGRANDLIKDNVLIKLDVRYQVAAK